MTTPRGHQPARFCVFTLRLVTVSAIGILLFASRWRSPPGRRPARSELRPQLPETAALTDEPQNPPQDPTQDPTRLRTRLRLHVSADFRSVLIALILALLGPVIAVGLAHDNHRLRDHGQVTTATVIDVEHGHWWDKNPGHVTVTFTAVDGDSTTDLQDWRLPDVADGDQLQVRYLPEDPWIAESASSGDGSGASLLMLALAIGGWLYLLRGIRQVHAAGVRLTDLIRPSTWNRGYKSRH